MTENDTIAAVSTAPGEGGIGIVRVSGDKAAEILGRIFVPPGSKTPDDPGFANKTMYYGHIIDPSSSETVDEALAVFMKGPKTYTGEDVCEIQCHGGSIPLRRILGIVIKLGAVPAQPGEFTKRAFLNGRLDLIQAGAVIDLIKSKTERGYHAAKEQAEGLLSEKVRAVRKILLLLLAETAVRIDYPDEFEPEGGDKVQYGLIISELRECASVVGDLLEGAEAGKMIRDGARVAIIGKPNTGKSSLYNALSREDAAIVTDTPGTTRDSLEIWLDIKGIPVLLSDTAGIRDSEEEIEKLGIERAIDQYQRADIAVFLLDGSRPLSKEDIDIAQNLNNEKKHIVAINKSDLPGAFGPGDVTAIIPFEGFEEKNILHLSLIDDEAVGMSRKAEGIRHIESSIEAFIMGGVSAGSSLLVTKANQKSMLEAAANEIAEAETSLEKGDAPEFAEINMRAAWEILGELIGERIADDVINKVFEEFCVGK